jgi:lysophospholipase L1-like esterase
VPTEVTAFANLAVSVYCTAVPVRLTGHPGSRTTSFIEKGDGTTERELNQAASTDHWYLLSAADVQATPEARAIVVIGDSITDGRGSTTNSNNRWTNNLARRLQANPGTANLSVLNQGIGGNRLLRDGLGPAALQRFDRDALTPPGVHWVIVFEGVNDLGTAVGARAKGEPGATAQDVIACFEQMIARAHARGLVIYGATIMAFQGFTSYDEARSEADRQTVNQWIRTSGRFDGVVDFDAITRDSANPLRLSSAVDGGDHLHPSAAGYQVMADSVDLGLFETKGRK